jgi:hypothetical protein
VKKEAACFIFNLKMKKTDAVCSSKMVVTPCITSKKHAPDFQYYENLKYPVV